MTGEVSQVTLLPHHDQRLPEHARREGVDDWVERGIQRKHDNHEHFGVV